MTEWFRLANSNDPQERAAIQPDCACNHLTEQVAALKQAVEEARAVLYFLGKRATDDYYATAKEHRFSSEETKISPRVRIDPRYGTPSFYWERLKRRFFRTTAATKPREKNGRGRSYIAYVPVNGSKSKVRMKVVLTSEHVKINHRTLRIASSEFAGEPEWARLTGELVEDQLQIIRRLNRQLSSLSRSISQLEKLVADSREGLR